jgi:hypothetical protein
MLAGAPSNWRPAWFETQTASTPSASARAATSGLRHALEDEGAVPALAQRRHVVPVGRGAQQVAHMGGGGQAAHLLLVGIAVQKPHARHAGGVWMPIAQAGQRATCSARRGVRRGGCTSPPRVCRSRREAAGTSTVRISV